MAIEVFDRSVLSSREDAILGCAIEGMTDAQISAKLGITQSTVNSYWVRIRGKLGQLSRTDLVARALRAEAAVNLSVAHERAESLQREVDTHGRVSHDFAHAEIYRAALDAMPEATFVCCHEALVRYANPRLEALFGYETGELIDQPVITLLPAAERKREGARILAYMADPQPLRLGIGGVVYGQRKNGSTFRVFLLIDARPTSNGNVATCVVRDFTSEIDDRRQFVATWPRASHDD